MWVTPLAVLAAMGGLLDGWSTAAAVAFTCATLGIAVVLGAWCGSTPWRSRFVSRRMAAIRVGGRRTAFVVLSAVGVLGAAVTPGDGWRDGGLRRASVECIVFVLTMALFAIRQWRFNPRARFRDGAVIVVASITVGATATLWPGSTVFAVPLAVCGGLGSVRRADYYAAGRKR